MRVFAVFSFFVLKVNGTGTKSQEQYDLKKIEKKKRIRKQIEIQLQDLHPLISARHIGPNTCFLSLYGQEDAAIKYITYSMNFFNPIL